MTKIENPTTAPFQHFDLMVETFDKTARLPIEEIIRDLLKPVVERDQEAVKTSQPTLSHIFLPLPQGLRAFFSCLTFIKDRRQSLTQFVGFFQLWRTFKKQFQLLLLFFLQILRLGSKRPHHPFERRVFILFQNLLEISLFLDTQLVGASSIGFCHMKPVDNERRAGQRFFHRVGVALTHINTNRGDRHSQTLRDRLKEGFDCFLLSIRQDSEQPQLIIFLLAGHNDDEVVVAFLERDFVDPYHPEAPEALPIDLRFDLSPQRAERLFFAHFTFARQIGFRAVNQIEHQPIITGLCVRAAQPIPGASLRGGRPSRTAPTDEPFGTQHDPGSQTRDRQMTQTDRLPVRVQFAGLFAAMRTSGALKHAFDRHSQVAAIKAGMKNADVRQIQWDFNQSWHRQFLLKPCCLTANLVIGETSRASHAKQSIGAHKILWRHGSYGRARKFAVWFGQQPSKKGKQLASIDEMITPETLKEYERMRDECLIHCATGK